ncbi:MAG: hypothetical protein ACR2GH_13840 [Pseudonocardia sp.]
MARSGDSNDHDPSGGDTIFKITRLHIMLGRKKSKIEFRKKMFATIAVALSAGFVLLGDFSPLSAPVSSAVSGSVTCLYDNNQEVGVWVEAGSKSGWATLRSNDYDGKDYNYGDIPAGTPYRLHVGCGGSTENWGTTLRVIQPYV